MSLIFDTSVLIDIEKRSDHIISKLQELSRLYPGQGQITFMSYFEFIFGLNEKSPKNKEKAIQFIHYFECIQTTPITAEILSDLKHKYEKRGMMFTLSDLFIAAQVIENKGILVTRDKQFNGIEELKKIIL